MPEVWQEDCCDGVLRAIARTARRPPKRFGHAQRNGRYEAPQRSTSIALTLSGPAALPTAQASALSLVLIGQGGIRLVTIAAGFLYRGGALLCTDTELTGGTLKTQAAKIVSFGCKGGMLSFAYAGNYDYALCVIDKRRRKLASVTAAELLPELERIIDKEYRRLVLSNPNQTWDHTLPYSFLISFSAPPDGVKMFVARQTSLRQVLSYECIGVGSDLASYLIGDHSVVGMSERRILSLAAFMLANVKANVSGCGGMSHFLGIRDDGAMAEFYSAVVPGFVPATSTEWLEFRAKGFDSMARDLFFSMADQGISDDEFRSRLEVFN